MRNLTILGKITVIKHLILPKILFSCLFLETPNGFVKKFENIVYGFIWNSKDKIKRNTLISDIQFGGLEMIDLECKVKSIRASWLWKILNQNSDWSFFGKNYLNLLGSKNLILHYNFSQHKQFPLLKNIPMFYQNVILAYNGTKEVIVPDNCEALLGEILWGNILFTHHNVSTKQNVTLFLKNWISSGFLYLRSLKFINGNIDETYICDKIVDKRNIYCEILVVKKALSPYKDILAGCNFTPIENVPNINFIDDKIDELQKITCKKAYQMMVRKKFEAPFQQKV